MNRVNGPEGYLHAESRDLGILKSNLPWEERYPEAYWPLFQGMLRIFRARVSLLACLGRMPVFTVFVLSPRPTGPSDAAYVA